MYSEKLLLVGPDHADHLINCRRSSTALHCSGQESGSGQGSGRVSMSWQSASSTGGVWSYRGECHELH